MNDNPPIDPNADIEVLVEQLGPTIGTLKKAGVTTVERFLVLSITEIQGGISDLSIKERQDRVTDVRTAIGYPALKNWEIELDDRWIGGFFKEAVTRPLARHGIFTIADLKRTTHRRVRKILAQEEASNKQPTRNETPFQQEEELPAEKIEKEPPERLFKSFKADLERKLPFKMRY